MTGLKTLSGKHAWTMRLAALTAIGTSLSAYAGGRVDVTEADSPGGSSSATVALGDSLSLEAKYTDTGGADETSVGGWRWWIDNASPGSYDSDNDGTSTYSFSQSTSGTYTVNAQKNNGKNDPEDSIEATVVEVTEISIKEGVLDSKTIGDLIEKEDLEITTHPSGHVDLVEVEPVEIAVGENTITATAGSSSASTKLYGVLVTGGWAHDSTSISSDGASFVSSFSLEFEGGPGKWQISGGTIPGQPSSGDLDEGVPFGASVYWNPTGSSHELELKAWADEANLDGPAVLGVGPLAGGVTGGLVLTGLGAAIEILGADSYTPILSPAGNTTVTISAPQAEAADWTPNTVTATVIANITGKSWIGGLTGAIYLGTNNPGLDIQLSNPTSLKIFDEISEINREIDFSLALSNDDRSGNSVLRVPLQTKNTPFSINDSDSDKHRMKDTTGASNAFLAFSFWPQPGTGLDASSYNTAWD